MNKYLRIIMFLLIVVTVLLLTAGCGEGKNTEQ